MPSGKYQVVRGQFLEGIRTREEAWMARVAVICFDALGPGAVPLMARTEAEHFAQIGHDVVLWSTGRDDVVDVNFSFSVERMADGRRQQGLIRLLQRVSSAAARLITAASAARDLWSSRGRFDVAISHGGYEACVAWLALGRTPCVRIFRMHNFMGSLRSQGRSYAAADRLVYFFADRIGVRSSQNVVAVSRGLADAVTRSTNKPVRAVSNGVELLGPPPHGAHRGIDVLFVGRLAAEKGIDALPVITHALRDEERLLVAGVGVLEQALVSAAPERLIRLGRIENAEARKLMRRSRILVVPSIDEPQGLVVIEGLDAGCVVVASAVGGICEMLQDGENGILLPVGVWPIWADTVRRVLDDVELQERLSIAAPQSVKKYGTLVTLGNLAAAYGLSSTEGEAE